MIKVSDLAAKAISASSRTFLSRFLHNGTEISGDVRSVITYKGSCGESAFTPGAVYSSYIDVVIDNCQESLSGKELTYQIGVVIDENTTEWYDIGKYTVHKPSTNVYTTSFTALGRISAKLGMMYQSKLTFPATIKNILNEISQNTGISIDASAFDTTGVIEKEINGYMYREVLAIIAGIFFAYVTEDTAGNIVFANYKNANVIATDGDRTSILPTFADTDTEITGVRVVGGEIIVKDPETGDDVYQDQTFISGNANVAIQNEFMTQALFDANNGNVTGYTYRPATVSISLGDFRIEPFDSLKVTDSLGVVRTVPCMSIIHRFDGGITTDIVAPELQDTDDSGTAFKGMFSQAIQRFQHELVSVKTLLAGTVTAEEIQAKYATIDSLNTISASIEKLQTDKLDASTADLKYATISNLQAAVGRISKLETDSLTAESAIIKSLQADKLDVSSADLKYATITNLNAAVGRISKLETDSLTAESAIIKSLQADKLDVSSADLKYATITNLNAAVGRISKLEADSLTVESAVIKNLQADKLSAAEAELQYATITNLDAALGRISTLETDSLTAESAEIKALQTDKLDVTSADLRYATISSLNAANANITKLQSEKATVEQLEAVDGKIDDLTSKAITTENLSASVAKLGYATIQELEVEKATIAELEIGYAKINIMEANIATIHKSLEADYFTAKEIEANFATISNLNAAVGRISTLETNSLTANSAVIKALQADKLNASAADLKYATISNLEAAVGRINNLETSSLTSESAIIKALQTGVADIETLIFGSATGTVIQTSFSNAVIARLGNAQIKSAMIDSLSADKITSGSINTNNVSIQSADGSMVIADNTIQIKDGGTVRVQIGKDASGNYSIVICDTAGNVMFNTSGITENAIKSAIIRDGMVASNANISASKLNIDSLFTEINNSTKTIKSTKIFVDDEKQTLDIVFKEMASSVDSLGEAVSTQGTQISAIQGQITSKIWQQDIDTVKSSLDESIDTLSTNYSTLNQTVSGLNSTVASHTSQIAGKADKSTVTTVSNKVSTLEQSLEGFQTTVSETYQTKNDMSKYSTTAQMNSAIEQKANQITSTVQSVEAIATTALSQGVEYIEGTQTAATNAWTGVTKSTSLFVGKTIAYKLPYAGTSSAASLNLTLPDGTTTGAKELRRITSTVTTNYGAGTVINMTYDGTYWRIADYDSNTYDRIRYNQAIKCGTTAIVAANIIVGASGVYKHLKLGTAFDITYPILYANSAIAASATGTNNYVSIPFAVKTTQNLTLTAYKPVYIKGTLSGKMFTPVSTAPLTQTEPTSADGYFYILLGTAYSTTNMYLLPEHPLFKYDNGAFKAIEQIVVENQSRITQTENSISSIVQNYATKTEVTQTAGDLTVKITQAQNTANAVQDEVDDISSIKYLTTNYSYPLATLKSYAKDGTNAGTWAVTSSAGVRVGDTVYLRMTNSDTGSYVYLALTVQSVPNATSVNGISHGFIDPGAIDVANTAKTSAANAAKTATNYLSFSSAGLVVGDMTASTLGKNVLINSSGVDIRSGTVTLASFKANKIELGSNLNISAISLLNGIGSIEAIKSSGSSGADSLRISLDDSATTKTSYLLLNAEYSTLHSKAITIDSGSGGLTLNAGYGTASLAVSSAFAMVNAPYLNIGNALGSYSKQSEIPYLKWNTWSGRTPYFGYAQDQTDGTFVWSITGTNYTSGLAIGGGTGNLLYKGNVVLHAGNYSSYVVPTSRTVNGKALSSNITLAASDVGAAASSHTHNYAGAASAGAAATKAISDQNGKQIDRIYCSMVPAGTNIPANADLNTTAYIKVGNYYCSSNANAATLKNSPITVAFMMQVYSPLSTTIDNETTGTYVYRIRKLINYSNGDEYVQKLQSSGTAGTFTYEPWKKIAKNTDSPSFADLTATGNIYLSTNSKALYAKDANGNNREVMRINNSTSSPTLVIGDGLYTASIGTTTVSAGTKVQLTTRNDRLILENSTDTTYSAFLRPNTNGKCTLGTSANRWYAVYAATSTIYTSDRREKENIMPLGLPQLMPVEDGAVETDLHSELFDRLKPVQYRFIDGNGKICYGLIAQDVIESMHEIGIDENQLDLVHHDFWKDEETGQKKDTYGLGYNNLLALLIHEVQKLKTEIKNLKGEQLC